MKGNRLISFRQFTLNEKFFHYILVLGMLTLALFGCTSNSKENADFPTNLASWNCIDTFDDFLYQMTEIGRSDPRYKMSDIYPSAPWQFVYELPESYSEIEILNGFGTEIELARSFMSQTELWIRNGDQTIFRYIPSTEDLFLISPHPLDKTGTVYEDVIVKDIFEMADDSIIGINYPQNHDTVWQKAIPLFSVYNELDGNFEFYDIGLKYHANEIAFDWVGMIPRDGVILANDKNTIWIYQQQDGLYNYDPLDSMLRHYEIPFSRIVQRMVISPEGNLLFSQEKEGSDWELTPGELLLYDPVSQTIEEINVPAQRWPDYGTLLYTDIGDLWIGIHGYLSNEGSWVLRNLRRQEFTELGRYSSTYNWVHPRLLFQSSNDYLWYTSDRGDFLGVNGSAWYDSVTDTGCWFTTESGNIVEDAQQTLWMLTDRKLYKYLLTE